MNESKPRYHPLTTVAFVPAFLLLIMPGQVDLFHDALYAHKFIKAILIIFLSTASVLAPLIHAQVQTQKYPERWKPRLLTKVIWGFVICNLIFNCLILVNFKLRDPSCLCARGNEAISTRNQIAMLEKAIQIYAMKNNGKFPDSIKELTTDRDNNDTLLKKENIIDNWGTPYGYFKIEKKIRISSAGPDRKMGTEDDITN